MKVKGKVKEETDLEDVDMNERDIDSSNDPLPTEPQAMSAEPAEEQPAEPMTPEQMAAILDKAMQILDKNGLTEQMKNDQPPEEDQSSPPPPPPQGDGQDDQPKDPRKVYTFAMAGGGMTQPLVADNIKQAFNTVGIGSVMTVYAEDYTPPPKSMGYTHDKLITPFYY